MDTIGSDCSMLGRWDGIHYEWLRRSPSSIQPDLWPHRTGFVVWYNVYNNIVLLIYIYIYVCLPSPLAATSVATMIRASPVLNSKKMAIQSSIIDIMDWLQVIPIRIRICYANANRDFPQLWYCTPRTVGYTFMYIIGFHLMTTWGTKFLLWIEFKTI